MNDIPKEGDGVYIECERYKGDAIVTYVAQDILFAHHLLPIQCDIDEGSLDQYPDFNCGQTMMRFSLKDIIGVPKEEKLLQDDIQGSLFDM